MQQIQYAGGSRRRGRNASNVHFVERLGLMSDTYYLLLGQHGMPTTWRKPRHRTTRRAALGKGGHGGRERGANRALTENSFRVRPHQIARPQKNRHDYIGAKPKTVRSVVQGGATRS